MKPVTEPNSKALLVFCDATNVNGLLPGDINGDSKSTNPTNVLRLSRAVKPTHGHRSQVIFYQDSAGWEEGNESSLSESMIRKICNAYVFLAQNYVDGDEIYIFGFSVGAYICRKLVSLIGDIGLLPTNDLDLFDKLWHVLVEGKDLQVVEQNRRAQIKFVGLWDTIRPKLIVAGALDTLNTDLPKCVTTALHAVSLQENRRDCSPVLWTIPQEGLTKGQELLQVWFPGANCDVGGGYDHHELADVALFWIAGELEKRSLLALNLDLLEKTRQFEPDCWATSQPHNGLKENQNQKGRLSDHLSRQHEIKTNDIFHFSILFAPTRIVHGEYMITFSTLRSEFGKDWKPKYFELTPFEKKCQLGWTRLSDVSLTVVESLGRYATFTPDNILKWVKCGSDPIDGAIQGSKLEDDEKWYVARTRHEGDLLYPAQAIYINNRWTAQTFLKSEGDIEILTGMANSTSWIKMEEKFYPAELPANVTAIRGGHESDGTPVYIVQAEYQNKLMCGRVAQGSWRASLIADSPFRSYKRGSVSVDSFNVLVLNKPTLNCPVIW